jgi:hypothetical protein
VSVILCRTAYVVVRIFEAFASRRSDLLGPEEEGDRDVSPSLRCPNRLVVLFGQGRLTEVCEQLV